MLVNSGTALKSVLDNQYDLREFIDNFRHLLDNTDTSVVFKFSDGTVLELPTLGRVNRYYHTLDNSRVNIGSYIIEIEGDGILTIYGTEEGGSSGSRGVESLISSTLLLGNMVQLNLKSSSDSRKLILECIISQLNSDNSEINSGSINELVSDESTLDGDTKIYGKVEGINSVDASNATLTSNVNQEHGLGPSSPQTPVIERLIVSDQYIQSSDTVTVSTTNQVSDSSDGFVVSSGNYIEAPDMIDLKLDNETSYRERVISYIGMLSYRIAGNGPEDKVPKLPFYDWILYPCKTKSINYKGSYDYGFVMPENSSNDPNHYRKVVRVRTGNTELLNVATAWTIVAESTKDYTAKINISVNKRIRLPANSCIDFMLEYIPGNSWSNTAARYPDDLIAHREAIILMMPMTLIGNN